MMSDEQIGMTLYMVLAMGYHLAPGMIEWLNGRGYSELHICPGCKLAEFRHVDSCPVAHMAQLMFTSNSVQAAAQVGVDDVLGKLSDGELEFIDEKIHEELQS